AEQHLDATAHLPGRLVGEGHRQDLRRTGPPGGDQVGDAMGEDAGLAAAGAGEDEQRTVGRLDGAPLRLVETGEELGRLGARGQGRVELVAAVTAATVAARYALGRRSSRRWLRGVR